MFIAHILSNNLDLSKSLRILDLCAAPGGKSTLIGSSLSEESLLVANEIIKTRVPVLTDNLNKWGPSNIFVSNNDPSDFKRLSGYFDAMLVDAPCSGSGMFRKDPDAISEWSEKAVELCSQRQQRILADAYPALKKDGLLIYSTCSYSKQENEDICDWLIENFDLRSVQVPFQSEWGIEQTTSDSRSAYGYRFYPHKVKGEGFFVACFIKNEETSAPQIKRARDSKLTAVELATLPGWLEEPANHRFLSVNDEYFAVCESHVADYQFLQSNLYLKKSGVRLGKIMGKDLVPNHELALSLVKNNQLQKVELDRSQAINYLKRDEFSLDDTGLKGWALMCYQGHAMGWAKLLHNRLNNYFPKELRIVNKSVN